MSDKTDYEIDSIMAEGMESVLADAVRKHPILYDKTHKHRFQSVFPEKHEYAWNKISEELNLEIESCKSLWSCIKQKFIKHRKRLDKGEPVSMWPTYDELQKWLDKHVKKRRTRHDFIKQIKVTHSQRRFVKSSTKYDESAESVDDRNDEDDDNIKEDEPDEEWTDLMEDKNTMVKIQLKRKDLKGSSNGSTAKSDSKKKFKIEVFSEQGTEIFNNFGTEIMEEEDRSKGEEPQNGGSKLGSDTSGQIEVIEVKETLLQGCKDNGLASRRSDSSSNWDANLEKLEQVVLKCVHLAERSVPMENGAAMTDSNDNFGKYIASLVRELPAEKRVGAQFSILQYATEVIQKESSKKYHYK